jgi:choline-sulfatase
MNGKKVEWRKTLGVESQVGKMVVDEEGFKYMRYDVAGIEEVLENLKKDPYEMTQFTSDKEYAGKLSELRKIFDSVWFPGK